ncbi:hypothetical protein V2J09_004139 [Rumex salicifolius]
MWPGLVRVFWDGVDKLLSSIFNNWYSKCMNTKAKRGSWNFFKMPGSLGPLETRRSSSRGLLILKLFGPVFTKMVSDYSNIRRARDVSPPGTAILAARSNGWSTSVLGYYKLNLDAVVVGTEVRVGVVCRDWNGDLIFVGRCRMLSTGDVLTLVSRLGRSNLVVESDSSILISKLNSSAIDLYRSGNVKRIEEIILSYVDESYFRNKAHNAT